MAVNSKHADYDRYAGRWRKIRDTMEGQECVHQAGALYLPMLTGQTPEEYAAYVARAHFYNATNRTVDGLTGMVFRKAPVIEVPDGMAEDLKDITLSGVDFTAFAEQVVQEVMSVSRVGILIDFPTTQAELLSSAQARSLGRRPFMRIYRTENIIDWHVGQVNNQTVITQLRLMECVETQTDEFTTVSKKQIRVLDLSVGFYRVRLFQLKEGSADEWVQVGPDIYPQMGGFSIEYIPFVFIGPRDTTPDVAKPLMLDLANLNIAHYQITADHRHGIHFTALPTAVVKGHQLGDNDTLRIGSSTAWVFREAEADAKFLEFQGKGLDTLAKELEHLEEQMASLGARMLAPEKRDAETAETAQIHRQGETSILASLSQSVGNGLTKALDIMRQWSKIEGHVSVLLNRDFMPETMSSDMLTALLKAVQAGRLSYESFFEFLKRGEIINPDRTIEDEQAGIQDDLTNLPALVPETEPEPDEAE